MSIDVKTCIACGMNSRTNRGAREPTKSVPLFWLAVGYA